MNDPLQVIGVAVAVASAICTLAGWVINLMTKSQLYDYDRDLRKRLHDWRSELNKPIQEAQLEIERLKERLRKNGH